MLLDFIYKNNVVCCSCHGQNVPHLPRTYKGNPTQTITTNQHLELATFINLKRLRLKGFQIHLNIT